MSAEPTFLRWSGPALSGALAVIVAGAVVLPWTDPGPLSDQMVQHLLLMNVFGPLVGLFVARRAPLIERPRTLWAAGLVQIVLLWAWHAPSVQGTASGGALTHVGLLAVLALASVIFWAAILRSSETAPWRGIVALLLTGKLACLLGGLLIFAPRDLYGLPHLAFALCSSGPSSLADQQLAGLLMVTACPLSYLTAGVVVAARMIDDLGRRLGSASAASS
ncbi:cytochrome c oxidase assembly protein [Flaviflagellibacter deserti]|uniref:Cytochrome c oxidase assembly protein n=1 Tax=Flaviflagellibacter deserti TaxID=2267266 RepID=A0ABV9Z1U4_9HYPH